jgi:hypothetical protein
MAYNILRSFLKAALWRITLAFWNYYPEYEVNNNFIDLLKKKFMISKLQIRLVTGCVSARRDRRYIDISNYDRLGFKTYIVLQ